MRAVAEQFSLFEKSPEDNIPRAEHVVFDTEQSIRREAKRAKEEWREQALEVIKSLALKKSEFTSGEIAKEINLEPCDIRAVGGVIRMAKSRGIIQWTGRYAANASNRMLPMRVWQSCRRPF